MSRSIRKLEPVLRSTVLVDEVTNASGYDERGVWLDWLTEDVMGLLKRHKTDLEEFLSSDGDFFGEAEDTLRPLLEMGADSALSHVELGQSICSTVRKFLLHALRFGGGASEGEQGALLAVSDSVSGWLSGRTHHEMAVHALPVHVLLGRGGVDVEKISREAAASLLVTSESGKRLLELPNAGGDSELSEALSFEVLDAMLTVDVALLECETEIEYEDTSKITDYSIVATAGDVRSTIGVSVARALAYKAEFEAEDAAHLLRRKLQGIHESSSSVTGASQWSKQLLHIFASNEQIAETVQAAYEEGVVSDELKGDSFVLVTYCPDPAKEEASTVAQLLERVFLSDSSARKQSHVVSVGRVRSVFSKEIALSHNAACVNSNSKRKKSSMKTNAGREALSEFTLSDEILSCVHELVADPVAGTVCVLCGHSTTKRVWQCTHGCGMALCGSCAWKWKEKFGS